MAESRSDSLRFAFVGGRLALDFTNTVAWTPRGLAQERLRSFDSVLAWGVASGAITDERRAGLAIAAARNQLAADRALDRARLVRELLHRLFAGIAAGMAPDPSLVAAFNERLSRSLAHLRLAPAADALRWSSADDDLDAVLHPVIWSAARILDSPDRGRLRRCANDACGWLFVDESRNRMRRWCEMRECGNRAKARRYYARHRNRRTATS